jgi:hypothetical protein
MLCLAGLFVQSIPARAALAQKNQENQEDNTKNMYAEVFGVYQLGLARDEEYAASETVALGYRMLDPLFLHVEAGHCHFKIRNKGHKVKGDGVFLNALLRWHALKTGPATLFFEGGIGVMTCNRNIPEDGMETNTTPQAGLGLLVPLYKEVGLVLGWRYVHLSHGLWKTDIANPGFNSSGVYGGIHWEF